MTCSLAGAKLVHVPLPEGVGERLINADPRQGVTHNFNRTDLPSGSRLVALVTCDGSTYCWVAVVSKEGATSTFQNRVRLTYAESFGPLAHTEVLRRLAPRLQGHAESAMRSQRLTLFPTKTGDGVVEAACTIDPGFAAAFQRALAGLGGARSFPIPEGSPWSIVAQEKDGVDLSLALAKMPPSRFADTDLSSDRLSPALDLLKGGTLEDRQIEIDAESFGGYELISRDIRGARVFRDPYGTSRVAVLNVNRHELEHTLGVDLIVRYEKFDSLLLVQYKRLLAEERSETSRSEWRYRPSRDQSFADEIARMDAARKAICEVPADHPRDYRLNDDPFFFKFCRSDIIDPDARGMVPGLYVHALDLQRFFESKHSEGPRGGHLISFENYARRFPNTLFVNLAQDGWIGSRSASAAITQYIPGALASRKSLVLARVTTHSPPGSASDCGEGSE